MMVHEIRAADRHKAIERQRVARLTRCPKDQSHVAVELFCPKGISMSPDVMLTSGNCMMLDANQRGGRKSY